MTKVMIRMKKKAMILLGIMMAMVMIGKTKTQMKEKVTMKMIFGIEKQMINPINLTNQTTIKIAKKLMIQAMPTKMKIKNLKNQ